MPSVIKKIAVIPAYNPNAKMLGVISSLKLHGFDVVIVNDGSDSGYDVFFENANEADKIIKHKENLGKGMAIKTGLGYVRKNFSEPYVVVTVDADGQHRTDDVLTVTRAALSNPGTLVVGSRRLGREAPFRSRSGNFFTRNILHALTPVTVYDTQSGLRAFDNTLTELMGEIPGERYEYEMQVLIELTRRKIPIKEVRILSVYYDDDNPSHFRTWYDAGRIYRVILKNAGRKNNF